MLAVSNGVVYVERCAVSSFKQIRRAKKAIRKAFQCQLDDLGFSLVELLSPCPTNWKMSPKAAWAWVNEEMVITGELDLGLLEKKRKRGVAPTLNDRRPELYKF